MGIFNFLKSFFSDSTTTTKKVTMSSDVPKKTTSMSDSNNVNSYLLNDPSTPDLVEKKLLPTKPKTCPSFRVVGFNGAQTEMWTKEWRAAQAYSTFIYTMNTMQPAFNSPIGRWPGTSSLIVMPEAGSDLNAYYDRRSLRFFAGNDPVSRKKVFTSESTDIVAHELGHALLDAARPDLWNMQALEVWSFHEAWSDMVAILTAMKHDKILAKILEETDGNLMIPNVVSRLAEEMGTTIYNYTKGKGGRKPGSLRDAVNSFVYSQPEKLPRHTSDDKLAAECHSFGRVFLGAYYEVMAKMFQIEFSEVKDKMEALRRTRSAASKLLARSAQLAPATPRFYDSVARTMLGLDKRMGGKYQEALSSVFSNRKILIRNNVKLLSKVNFEDLKLKEEDVVSTNNGLTAVRIQSTKNLRLSDHFGIKAQADNPLYNCEIEVPNESYMEFDEKGNLINSIATSEKVAINSARECIKYLHDNHLVDVDGKDINKQFAIKDGKLVRNYIN